MLAYITSNSWMKSLYGKTTRRYLTALHQPIYLIDMGKDVFDAIVDTNILFLRENSGSSTRTIPAVDLDASDQKGFVPDRFQEGHIQLASDRPWSILSLTERHIMEKMKERGTRLADWDLLMNYGIKTGYNDAFIIDKDTRNSLINEDPRSKAIIRPILRGRDIQRYRAQWANLYLIDTHNGYASTSAINIDDFPAIKSYLLKFYDRLKKQYDKGQTPFNLRSCTYYKMFAREKLFWMHMSPRGRFAYSSSPIFCNQKAFVVTGDSLKYLCAVLNSRLVTWMVSHIGVTTGMGLVQWDKFTVVRIPIPHISAQEQRPFIHLIDEILTLRSVGPSVSITGQEKAIDQLVYELYGLTDDEVLAIEKSVAGQFQSTKGDGSG